MLKHGYTVFDCQVDRLLSENEVYQCYLLKCSTSSLAKLFLLRPDSLFDQEYRKAFFEHAEKLTSQSFPSVGTPIKVEEIDGEAACLYPFASGIPLVKILDNGCSIRQAVQLIENIATRLSAPHAVDLCHGNLSPATIFIDGEAPYLADFSLGQLIRIDYKSGIDPQYTSPEQVRGELPGMASDIYNLGCIFYHLLIGQPPFSGNDAFSIAKQHLQGEFPRLPEELSLFQPILDLLVKTEGEERITIDEFVQQISQLSTQRLIDQLQSPASLAESRSEEICSTDGETLLDEAVDGAEIAARIEARLNAHVENKQRSAPNMSDYDQPDDVTDELSYPARKEKLTFWRFLFILLLGVLIGSALYFLFARQSPTASSVVVESVVDVDTELNRDLDRGLKLWQEKDFNGAEEVFKQIINSNADDPRAYNNLAAFYAAQGNYDQARDYLEQALATDEEYAAIYHNLGAVYAEMARGAYGRALRLDQGKALLTLPVFTSQGLSHHDPTDGGAVTPPETTTEKAIAAVELPKSAVPSPATEPLLTDASVVSAPVATEMVEKVDLSEAVSADVSAGMETTEQPVESDPSQVAPVLSDAETGEHFLRRWAEAWSNQDVDSYLTFYADQFIPPGGRTRALWEDQRRSRLTKPKNIKVKLDDFRIKTLDNGNLTVELIQTYTSNLLTDRTQKIFELQPVEKSWKILRERSLGVVR